jgi:transposase
VASRFTVVLNSREKLLAYEATDGRKTVREIADEVGVKKSSVSTWWREWAGMGMVEPGPEREGRPRRLISLKSIGLL